jgi:hypothetical protein
MYFLIANLPRAELYERHSGGSEAKNYSIRLSVSEGAHASSVLDSAVDAVSRPRRCAVARSDRYSGLSDIPSQFNLGKS